MVHKKERLLASTKVPWEVVQASVEWVQPTEDELVKLFVRLGRMERPPSPRPRSNRIYSSPANILRKIDISPDFSEFSHLSKRRVSHRRGRSASCLLELQPYRSSRADFDSILRDISDDSLYTRFKNSADTDPNNNTTQLKRVTRICLQEDEEEIWTDISLEDVSQPTSLEESVSSDEPDVTTPVDDFTRDRAQSEEYLRFSEDVYRRLSGAALEGPGPPPAPPPASSARAMKLFDQLLSDIYRHGGAEERRCARRRSEWSFHEISRRREKRRLVRFLSQSGGLRDRPSDLTDQSNSIYENLSFSQLQHKSREELSYLCEEMKTHILETGKWLVKELEERDELLARQQGSSELLTAYLQAASNKTSEDTQVKFSVSPAPGDTGFTEWSTAMKMVARLPEGVPPHFRKTLWLSLAEKHLSSRGVVWQQAETGLFSESCNPDDEELSVQIVKDLHRTGCSLFCGVSGQHNQAVLKRVLLAFARWNKNVGYCQGLNMLAALILQVMGGSQSSTVKVMIYLIEGVLPESYFGQNLRGLSVDMAVFRDLLRLKLPDLSRHLDQLQHDSKEAGTSYEPPLMDVFTMQWFLTIFSNCLPQATVLRVWDLLFLEGNEVLLKTALAIWSNFSEKIQAVRSADEFYSIMAVHTREMLEFGLMDPNSLIKAIDTMSVPEVAELREKYVYNITPWTVATVAKKGLKLLYDPYDSDDEHYNNMQESGGAQSRVTPFSNHPDREKIALDISVLKKQYMKLRERQRQAHIIFTAACSSDNLGTSSSPALNHLLLGKSALLSMKGRRIEGTIPPNINIENVRRIRSNSSSSSASSSSSSTELCDDSSESEVTESCSPLPPPEHGEDEAGPKRRNSERALMQILQENSEILRRIQSQSAIKSISEEDREREDLVRDLKLEVVRGSAAGRSPERREPDDITEIRRKYDRLMNKQWSLDAPRNSGLLERPDKPRSFDTSWSEARVRTSPETSLDAPWATAEPQRLPSPKTAFSPFPSRSPRRKSQLGVQLGLYSPDSKDS